MELFELAHANRKSVVVAAQRALQKRLAAPLTRAPLTPRYRAPPPQEARGRGR